MMTNTQHKKPAILMMAAGTGGHVFPALAVADELAARGAKIFWLGTPNGMENDLIGDRYPFFAIDMQGLRGKGIVRAIKLPFMLLSATYQAKKIIKANDIDVVIGFGGYVTAPGGLAAKLAHKPLVIHEQNAVAGMSNRNLVRYADRVLQAFDGAFGDSATTVGNPVRSNIGDLPKPASRYHIEDTSPLKVLVVGGSLGAAAINEAVVEMLKCIQRPISLRHQCGKANHDAMLVRYSQANLDTNKHTFWLSPFIEDMSEAYAWADVVVCRAGALTVTEVSNAGIAAIFVPLPHAVDDHQTANAKTLTDIEAAILLPQSELTGESLAQVLSNLTRQQCLDMAEKAHAVAKENVANQVADIVWQLVDKQDES